MIASLSFHGLEVTKLTKLLVEDFFDIILLNF
jgi:hypothetical protein